MLERRDTEGIIPITARTVHGSLKLLTESRNMCKTRPHNYLDSVPLPVKIKLNKAKKHERPESRFQRKIALKFCVFCPANPNKFPKKICKRASVAWQEYRRIVLEFVDHRSHKLLKILIISFGLPSFIGFFPFFFRLSRLFAQQVRCKGRSV